MENDYWKLYKVTLWHKESDLDYGETFGVFVCVEIPVHDFCYTSGFSKAAERVIHEYPESRIKSIEVIDEEAFSVSL